MLITTLLYPHRDLLSKDYFAEVNSLRSDTEYFKMGGFTQASLKGVRDTGGLHHTPGETGTSMQMVELFFAESSKTQEKGGKKVSRQQLPPHQISRNTWEPRGWVGVNPSLPVPFTQPL